MTDREKKGNKRKKKIKYISETEYLYDSNLFEDLILIDINKYSLNNEFVPQKDELEEVTLSDEEKKPFLSENISKNIKNKQKINKFLSLIINFKNKFLYFINKTDKKDTNKKVQDTLKSENLFSIFEGEALSDKLIAKNEEDSLEILHNPFLSEEKESFFVSKKVFRYILMTVSLIIFAAAFFDISSRLIGYRRAGTLYGQMQDIFHRGTSDGIDLIYESGPVIDDQPTLDLLSVLNMEYEGKQVYEHAAKREFYLRKENFDTLSEINSDFYGWIFVGGTQIDYPVVIGRDNDYYLDHGFDGSSLKAGSIYVDFRNNREVLLNYNTVIYGHNMKNGSMFATLLEYENENVFRNEKIKLYTENGLYEYTPFSVYVADPKYQFFRTDFKDKEDYIDFLHEMKLNSYYESPITFDPEDKIITLMTCTNTIVNNRFVVHAKLTSQIQ